jgi:hypothetical protein
MSRIALMMIIPLHQSSLHSTLYSLDTARVADLATEKNRYEGECVGSVDNWALYSGRFTPGVQSFQYPLDIHHRRCGRKEMKQGT